MYMHMYCIDFAYVAAVARCAGSVKYNSQRRKHVSCHHADRSAQTPKTLSSPRADNSDQGSMTRAVIP